MSHYPKPHLVGVTFLLLINCSRSAAPPAQVRGGAAVMPAVVDKHAPSRKPTDGEGVEIVRRLYREYPFRGARPFYRARPEELSWYFEPRLAGLLATEIGCVQRENSVCALDFSPLYDLDPDGPLNPGVVVASMRANGDDSEWIEVTMREEGKEKVLRFQIVQTMEGWRIADIRYPRGTSLRRVLERAFGESKPLR